MFFDVGTCSTITLKTSPVTGSPLQALQRAIEKVCLVASSQQLANHNLLVLWNDLGGRTKQSAKWYKENLWWSASRTSDLIKLFRSLSVGKICQQKSRTHWFWNQNESNIQISHLTSRILRQNILPPFSDSQMRTRQLLLAKPDGQAVGQTFQTWPEKSSNLLGIFYCPQRPGDLHCF